MGVSLFGFEPPVGEWYLDCFYFLFAGTIGAFDGALVIFICQSGLNSRTDQNWGTRTLGSSAERAHHTTRILPLRLTMRKCWWMLY